MTQFELDTIKNCATGFGVDWRFILAIRCTENGIGDVHKGAPFGMIYVSRGPAWQENLRACCRWVAKEVLRIATKLVQPPTFFSAEDVYSPELIAEIGKRFSPPASNPHWYPNVTYFYKRIISGGPGWLLEHRV